MYCGEKDHVVEDCPHPKKRSHPARISEVSFSDDRPPGNGPAQRDQGVPL
jgi:hypothetical protein